MTNGLQRATAALTSDERILWSGVPDASVLLSPGDVLLIPFSLLWTGFAVFWEYTALAQSKAPGFFPFFGGVFVAIGLYFVFFRFVVGNYRRRTTSYVLTNRRAIVVGARTLRSVSVDPNTLSTSWSRDSRRVSVNFGFQQGQTIRGVFGRSTLSMSAMTGPFTGWDPLNLNPTPIVFQDVVDPAGLEGALAELAAG